MISYCVSFSYGNRFDLETSQDRILHQPSNNFLTLGKVGFLEILSDCPFSLPTFFRFKTICILLLAVYIRNGMILINVENCAGGLLDFDTTLPLVAIHFILLMIVLKFVFYSPAEYIHDRRFREILFFVNNGVIRVKKLIRVFYKKRIREFLKNAVFTRSYLIFSLFKVSYERKLVAQHDKDLIAWLDTGFNYYFTEIQETGTDLLDEKFLYLPMLDMFPPEFIKRIFSDEE